VVVWTRPKSQGRSRPPRQAMQQSRHPNEGSSPFIHANFLSAAWRMPSSRSPRIVTHAGLVRGVVQSLTTARGTSSNSDRFCGCPTRTRPNPREAVSSPEAGAIFGGNV
jgi:hypothetical protein